MLRYTAPLRVTVEPERLRDGISEGGSEEQALNPGPGHTDKIGAKKNNSF